MLFVDDANGRAVDKARDHFANHGIPQLCIFRACETEDVAALAIETRDVTLIFDELDQCCSGKKWRSESVKKIVQYGRHYRVDLWGGFRAVRNVNEDVVGQGGVFFLMHLDEADNYTLRAIAEKFGQRYADAVKGLNRFEFVIRAS